MKYSETIKDINNDGHVYHIRKSLGFDKEKQETIFCDTNKLMDYTSIRFVEKKSNGQIVPGLLNEQLIIVLKDRIKKLNAKFPHPENENMLQALDDFLEASKRRVQERTNRGVMGELKE